MRNKKLQGQTLFHVTSQKQNGLKSKESGRKSPKKKISPKGKRRLSFPSKKPGLLSGKRFYLDLVGEGKIKLTRSTIGDLGGSVEEFVSKEVYCIITDRVTVEEVIAANTLNKKGTQVPLFGPSPSPLQQISSNKCYANSPLSTDSPQSFEVKTLNATRGKALLKHVAGTQRQGSTNLLENARKWKVRVLHLDQFLNWSKEKISQCKRTPVLPDKKGPRSSQTSSSFRVKSLKSPFIKIEEQSRTYRPVYVELEEWPMMHFESVAGSCPFEKPKIKDDLPDKEIEQMSDKETNKDDSSQEMSEKASESPKDKKEDIKGGYCECCLVRFSNIKQHLKGDQHRAYATNNANYSELDAVISRGNTFDEFLAAIVQKSEAERQENSSSSSNFAESPSTSSKEIIANCFDSRNAKGKIASTNAFLETCQQEKNIEPNQTETKVTQSGANKSEANSLTGVKNGIGPLEKDPENGEESTKREKPDPHGELSICNEKYIEDANVCTHANAEMNTDTALPRTADTANIDKQDNVAIDVANSLFSNSNAFTAEIGTTVQLNTNTAVDANIPCSANAHTDSHSLTAAAIIYNSACGVNNASTNAEVAAYYADDTGPGVTAAADTDAGVAVKAVSAIHADSSITGIIDTNVDALATTAIDSNACITADFNSDIAVTLQNKPVITGHDRPTVDKPAKKQEESDNNLKLESFLAVENPSDIVSKLRGDDSATLDPTKTVPEGFGEKIVPKAVCDKLEPYAVCEPDKINLEKATDERFDDQDLAEKVEECELKETKTAEIDPSSVIKLHAESPVRRRKRTKRNFVIPSSPRSEIFQQSQSLQTDKTSKACSSSNSIENKCYIGKSTEEHSTNESVITKETTLDCNSTAIGAPGTKTISQLKIESIENVLKEQASNRKVDNAINENNADNEKIVDRRRCSGEIDNVKQKKLFPKLRKRSSPRLEKLKSSMCSVVEKKQRQNGLDDSSDHLNISSNDSAEEGDFESENERLRSQNIELPTKRCTRLSLPADLKKSHFFSPLRERLGREGNPQCKPRASKFFSHPRQSFVVYSGSSTQSDEDTMTCEVLKEDLKFSGSSTVDLPSPEHVTEITQLTSHLDDITTGAAYMDDITTGAASTTTLGIRTRRTTSSESECSKEKHFFSDVPEDTLINLPKCSPEGLFRSKVGTKEVEMFHSQKGNLDSLSKGNSPEKFCRFSSPGSEIDYKNKVDDILCQLNSPIVCPRKDHVHYNHRDRKCKKVLAMSQPTSSTSKLREKKAEDKENSVINMNQSPKRRKRSRDKLATGSKEDGFRQAKRSCTEDEEWLPSAMDSSMLCETNNNIYNSMLTKRKQKGLLEAKLLTSDSGNSIAGDLNDFLVEDFQKGINMHERIKTRKRFASLVASAKSFDSPITPPKKRTNKLSINKITCSQSSVGAACIEQKNKQFNLVSGDAEEGRSQTMYRPIKDYTGNDAVPVVTSSSTPVPNVNPRSYHRQSPKKCAKLPNSDIHRTYPRRARSLPSESILEKSPSRNELNDSASVLSQSANSSLVTDSSSSFNTSNPVTLSISNALLSSRRGNSKKKSSVQKPPGNTSTTKRRGRKPNSGSMTATRDMIGLKKRNNRTSFEFCEDEYDFTDY